MTRTMTRPRFPGAANFRAFLSLTMRLSDARLRRRKSKVVNPDHRPSPRPNEDAPRDRSNRLLDETATVAQHAGLAFVILHTRVWTLRLTAPLQFLVLGTIHATHAMVRTGVFYIAPTALMPT